MFSYYLHTRFGTAALASAIYSNLASFLVSMQSQLLFSHVVKNVKKKLKVETGNEAKRILQKDFELPSLIINIEVRFLANEEAILTVALQYMIPPAYLELKVSCKYDVIHTGDCRIFATLYTRLRAFLIWKALFA